MSFGDFGNFSNWTPKDHALNKMVYDKAHKGGSGGGGGGNDSNSGCATVLGIVFVIIVVVLFSHC